MATPLRTRKRVHAILRAPDGSAYDECDECGALVAITLLSMHECKPKRDLKSIDDEIGIHSTKNQRFDDQPRSAFRFFMERFMKTWESEDLIEADRKGFAKWKIMSNEERAAYQQQAKKVNLAYDEALCEEQMDYEPKEDDEADSVAVRRFIPAYEYIKTLKTRTDLKASGRIASTLIIDV